MFHVLLVLPILASFGALAWLVLSVGGFLLGGAFLWELLLGLFCKTKKWLLWLPVLFGVFGLLLSLSWLSFSPEMKTAVFVFWGLFALCLLCGRGLSCLLKKALGTGGN